MNSSIIESFDAHCQTDSMLLSSQVIGSCCLQDFSQPSQLDRLVFASLNRCKHGKTDPFPCKYNPLKDKSSIMSLALFRCHQFVGVGSIHKEGTLRYRGASSLSSLSGSNFQEFPGDISCTWENTAVCSVSVEALTTKPNKKICRCCYKQYQRWEALIFCPNFTVW